MDYALRIHVGAGVSAGLGKKVLEYHLLEYHFTLVPFTLVPTQVVP
jgi:hypothetical protein